MKVVTVVGARPQFIKAAVVSHELRKYCTEVLVHTGQHYDYNMSETFFKQLNIPTPDYNLGISGGTHAQMTAKMLVAIEEVLQKEKPDYVLVYGDTNSTLSAALAAAKLHIPICHVESGTRTHCETNPEEINRICTDHLSKKLLVCTESGMTELKHEGLVEKACLVGDPMYDAFMEYSDIMEKEDIVLSLLEGGTCSVPENYYYLTCHREENTNNEEALLEIFKAMDSLEYNTVYPVHPRNKERALRLQKQYSFNKIILTEPVGYFESTALVKNAYKIVTDSGGLQREAFFAKKQCITVLDFVVWPETMEGDVNQLASPTMIDIVTKLKKEVVFENEYQPFGDAHSAKKIVEALLKK